MSMTSRERMGTIVLVAIFCILGVILYFTFDTPGSSSGTFEDNALVRARMNR